MTPESKKSILFIAPHYFDRSPGQRFRFEQYFPYLEEAGFEIELSNIITEKDDKWFYQPGNYFKKIGLAFRAWRKRARDARRAKNFDIVFIYREAYFTGTTRFERKFKKSGAKIIFDFDDAIWLSDVGAHNKKLSWLKKPGKTSRIAALADLVIVGNQYLADYASRFNPNVKIIVTTVNTNWHKPKTFEGDKTGICIGWSGSQTTVKHFETVIPALRRLKEKYGDQIYFKLIGDQHYVQDELGIKGVKWQPHTEVKELSEIDIGIMPLPDDEWSKGKCGLKGLVYMAMETPTIMSPVGVNSEIIDEGVNGMLASNEEEWYIKLSLLIEDADLRRRLGVAGKSTVESSYSRTAIAKSYVRIFEEVLE